MQTWTKSERSSATAARASGPRCSSRLTSIACFMGCTPELADSADDGRAITGAMRARHSDGPGTWRAKLRKNAVRPGCHKPSSSENRTHEVSNSGTSSSSLWMCSVEESDWLWHTATTSQRTARAGPSAYAKNGEPDSRTFFISAKSVCTLSANSLLGAYQLMSVRSGGARHCLQMEPTQRAKRSKQPSSMTSATSMACSLGNP
mmetsp:Transcript_107195/g.269588  ORF Transcript_107195/g.269588 Transcript_107195/m.269588 type:complete len:204 (+) Transcript_107195:210-821(+)